MKATQGFFKNRLSNHLIGLSQLLISRCFSIILHQMLFVTLLSFSGMIRSMRAEKEVEGARLQRHAERAHAPRAGVRCGANAQRAPLKIAFE